MIEPLTADQLAKIRADVQLAAAGPMVGVPRGAERYEAWVRIGDQHGAALLAEVDRLTSALAAIATIASALGDSLPGDNWSAANAIHEIATGKVSPEQGLADAWDEDDDEDEDDDDED